MQPNPAAFIKMAAPTRATCVEHQADQRPIAQAEQGTHLWWPTEAGTRIASEKTTRSIQIGRPILSPGEFCRLRLGLRPTIPTKSTCHFRLLYNGRLKTDTRQCAMKILSEERAIDKIFRRRDRYDIPDWQRQEVWNREKKQRLIDSILRGWKLPKFYFIELTGDNYLVEDGQQRLNAIWEFFSNELPLSAESGKQFGGRFYRDLPRKIADAFDDFEITYDLISGATDEELKEIFQRLQEGMPLTSSEKLNAVPSKLTDYCRSMARHDFFGKTIVIPNTRYAHFDIMAKVATVEIEGLDAGLRLDDIRKVFLTQKSFAPSSATGKRIKAALDFLQKAFNDKGASLRTRTIVQSLLTLTCKLIATGRSAGHETRLRRFFESFMTELAEQVEMGQAATDSDYVMFQRSVSANVKGGAKARQEILLRKLFRISPDLAEIFDPSIIAESGVSGRVASLGDSIANLIGQINGKYAAHSGEDLFKATNKTTQAMLRIRRPVKNLAEYKGFIDDLYFLFRESAGTRLDNARPPSFTHVNDLRTDLRHDVDHGDAAKIRSKRRKAGATFAIYAGNGSPDTLEPVKFQLVQSNLLGTIEGDLRNILS
jgi:hypothetical protein